MASATPATSSTKETTNFARLCRVLVDVGTYALRDYFDAICTPPTLHTVLTASEPTLQSLRKRKIINATQWGKLFPPIPDSVCSKDFDITLLMILLRNICGLAPPLTGWDTLPDIIDVSREADIVRVKYLRNTIYAHAVHASVDDATFHKHWKEIRDTLVRLGGVKCKVAIDNLEFCSMDHDSENRYKELLNQWKNDEDNIREDLKKIGSDVKEFGMYVREISTDVKDLAKRFGDSVASPVTTARETNDEGNGPKLEEILDTSLMCREKYHENELLTSFCKSCEVCICEKCKQARHSHHITVNIHQAAKQHEVDMEEIVDEMKREIADYKVRVEKIEKSFRRSRERYATARGKVMACVQELTRLLEEHEETMINSLDDIDGREQKEHAVQLEHVHISMNQLQEHVERCESILRRKKSVEILQKHSDVIGRCRSLLNAEKLNVYKPSHVRYQINEKHLENVRSVVPAMGRVVVRTTDPFQSVAEGTGLQKGDIGSEATIKIKTKDTAGNQCYDENDEICIKVQSPSGKELSHKIEPATNSEEYNVTYTPDCVGRHEVMIAVNSEPLTGSPWRVQVTPHCYKSLFSFGSYGKGAGKFMWPISIAIDDKSKNVAVADFNRVQILSLEGAYLRDIVTTKPIKPSSVAFTESSELIVIASDKILFFNESFKLVKYVKNKQLKQPRRLTIAHDGRMVVCEGRGETVKVLSSDGSQLLLTIADRHRRHIWYAVCHQNIFFISYLTAGNVEVFSEDGVFLYSIGTSESGNQGNAQLSFPACLAVDRFNNLVVCDQHKARLQVFTLDGKFVNTIEGQHTGLTGPHSVAVSSTGHLFVTDFNNHGVHVLQ